MVFLLLSTELIIFNTASIPSSMCCLREPSLKVPVLCQDQTHFFVVHDGHYVRVPGHGGINSVCTLVPLSRSSRTVAKRTQVFLLSHYDVKFGLNFSSRILALYRNFE